MAAHIATGCRLAAVYPHLRRSFTTSNVTRRKIKIGQGLPDVNLYEGNPPAVVNVKELFTGRKGIIFSVLGAYTPGCSQAHFPEYLKNHEKFKDVGYTEIVCVSVNDPYVMAAWSEEVNPDGRIRMLADMNCEFTKALHMEQDYTPFLGNVRTQRYSLVVEDSVITHVNWEPDNTGLACLLCIQRSVNDMAQDATTGKKRIKFFQSSGDKAN